MTCVAPECDKPPKATKYLCWAHWYRQKEYGSFDLPALTCMECGKVVGAGRRKKLCDTCKPIVRERRVALWTEKNHDRLSRNSREYYLKDPAKAKERAKAWKLQNSELVKSRAKEYRESDPERYRGYALSWSKRNPEKVAEAAKRYREANPEAYRETVRRRRARKRGAPTFDVSGRDIARLLTRHRGCCAYCNEPLSDGYHIDHVVPLSRGGYNGIGNYLPSCPTCNDSKGAKFLYEWLHWKRTVASQIV